MQFFKKSIALSALFIFSAAAFSQGVTIKPFISHPFVRLGEVNDNIAGDIRTFRESSGAAIPSPGEFNGERTFGAQAEYHLNEDYFFNISVSFYNETVETHFDGLQPAPIVLDYQREVRSYDFMLNLDYYFNYNNWKRFNKYLGVGVGLILVNADSKTFYKVKDELLIDSDGEFTKTGLSALLSAGMTYRLASLLSLWGEGGYQVSNVGQLDGKVTTIDNPTRTDFTTNSAFDLSGFFIRGGLGITLPFLN